MRTLALVLLKISANSWYLKGTLEKSGASASFVKLIWMSKEQRQSLKLWELRSFNAYKNAAVLMIAILGHLELDIEVSDAGMETAKSNNCKGILESNRDANSMLAAMWEGVRFSCKDRQKFINLFT